MLHGRVMVSKSTQDSRRGGQPVSWTEFLEPVNCLELGAAREVFLAGKEGGSHILGAVRTYYIPPVVEGCLGETAKGFRSHFRIWPTMMGLPPRGRAVGVIRRTWCCCSFVQLVFTATTSLAVCDLCADSVGAS